MKSYTKQLIGAVSAAVLLTAGAAAAQPQVSIQSEQAAHPRLNRAIQEMQAAYDEMKAAPDDFGGRKVAAMADTARAIHSVKAALYFRLHMDDAAIDRAR